MELVITVSALRAGGPSGEQAQREMDQEAPRRARPSSPVVIEGRTIARPSGARRGATTWNPTATTRTACRAAAPTSATARWWTCRSSRARSRRWSAARSCTRSRSPSRRCRRRTGRHQAPLRRPDRLAGGAAARQAVEERDRHRHRTRRRPVPQAGARSRCRAPARTGPACASTSPPSCTASARGSITNPSCSSCLRKVDHLELIEGAVDAGDGLRRQGKPEGKKTIAAGGELADVFGIEAAGP